MPYMETTIDSFALSRSSIRASSYLRSDMSVTFSGELLSAGYAGKAFRKTMAKNMRIIKKVVFFFITRYVMRFAITTIFGAK